MRIFIFLSLLLHTTLVLVLQKPAVTTDDSETPISFEVVENKTPVAVNGRGGVGKSRLKKLLPQRDWYKEVLSAKNHEGSFDHRTGDYDPLVDAQTYLEGTTALSGNTDLWDFNKYIFQRIDSQLMFDSILAQYNHFGVVYIEFTVNPDGTLIPSSLRASAADKILKVHSLRALRKALASSFELNKRNPLGTETLVRAQFSYLLGDSSYNFQKQKMFAKSVFAFKRATKEKPIPTNLADHLMNGGIDYDPFAMAERWEKYKRRQYHKTTQFDPFESYRRDPDYNI